jgi:predicted lysophospholipase L1 biosynthesis ABC-type transport system permease subunit
MSLLLPAVRLAVRDLRRRPGTAALLVVAMLAATTTLTLSLVVRSSADAPWERTSALTAGPHVVATNRGDAFNPTAMADLARASGVVTHAGPYPRLDLQRADAFTDGTRQAADVQVMGRDVEASTVDRPLLTDGTWISPGQVVLEASFAAAVDAKVGDRITVAGRPFVIAGIAVTAAQEPMPFNSHGGLIWATRTDTASLADRATGRASVLMLRLTDPAAAAAFATAHDHSQEPRSGPTASGKSGGGREVIGWQHIRAAAQTDVQMAMFGLILGTVCLALLAFASVAVAVTGRMAVQARRAALLKAVGATPVLVAVILLVQYLATAVLAAGLGLVIGAATAPRLAAPITGVVGAAGPAAVTPTTMAIVIAAAFGLMAVATLVPAVRAARTSTVRALQRPGRPPGACPD